MAARTRDLLGRHALLFYAAATPSHLLDLLAEEAPSSMGRWTPALSQGTSFVVSMLIWASMVCAMVWELNGAGLRLGEAAKLGFLRFFAVLGTTLSYLASSVLGSLFLVVPGLIAAASLSAAPTVAVVESMGPIRSLMRSAAMTKGNRWRVLAIDLGVFYLPALAIAALPRLLRLAGAGGAIPETAWPAIEIAANFLLAPLTFAVPAVVYDELRTSAMRREAAVAAVFR